MLFIVNHFDVGLEWRVTGGHMARDLPIEFRRKVNTWKMHSARWNVVHYTTGFGSAVLSTIIATNVKGNFLSSFWATLLAALAAGLAFLVTALGAQTRGKTFELAARELEGASAVYMYDDSVPETVLGEAVVRGVKILKDAK